MLALLLVSGDSSRWLLQKIHLSYLFKTFYEACALAERDLTHGCDFGNPDKDFMWLMEQELIISIVYVLKQLA